jgi:hypothetical protein
MDRASTVFEGSIIIVHQGQFDPRAVVLPKGYISKAPSPRRNPNSLAISFQDTELSSEEP